MELWIRSQDKLKLLKVNDIAIVKECAYKDWCIETKIGQEYILKDAWYIFINNIKVATYFNEERALEVLDEIQERLTRFNTTADYGCVSNIYEMPKE